MGQNISNSIIEELIRGHVVPELLEELEPRITEHFGNIIIETILNNLDDKALGSIEDSLKKQSSSVYEVLMKATAQKPDIAKKIEQAVRHECMVLVNARQAIQN